MRQEVCAITPHCRIILSRLEISVHTTSSASSIDSPRGASARPWLFGSGLAVLILALVKIAIHLYTGRRYGIFVDELYYLDCARHLAWGYVDQPPLVAVLAWIERATLGDSLLAIRSLTILAGAAEVLLTGLIARELGGGRFAQFSAALCVLVAPGILGVDHFFSMNSFEPLFWMGCAYLLIRIVRTGDARPGSGSAWSPGSGSKINIPWACSASRSLPASSFQAAIASHFALVLRRRGHRILIFLPNLLWNIAHHFPFLELQHNIKHSGRDVALSPLRFIIQEQAAMLPLSLPIWLAGLWFFFFTASGRAYRFLGWAFVITAAVIMLLSPRVYYLFPAFPIVFAGGAVLWEQLLHSVNRKWALVINGVWVTAMILAGAALAPIVLPVLSPEDYIRYAKITHQEQPRIENNQLGPLPQLFADQFGWPEMAATVASVYKSLPADVRSERRSSRRATVRPAPLISTARASACPGSQRPPESLSMGPGNYTGESMIVLGDRRARLEEIFTRPLDGQGR